jgi:hypothetical protein
VPDRWVVLDVGETLVDETRVFRTWADIFGLPELTLMAVLGGSISNANDADGWRRFFELIQHPDWQDSRPDFEARYGALRPDDLYPDALRAMGVAKPDPAFFARTLELLGSPSPTDVAYVGDRVDNDVRPSAAAGMRAVWLRRGPWGLLHEDPDGVAHLVVRSLDELVERIEEAWPLP